MTDFVQRDPKMPKLPLAAPRPEGKFTHRDPGQARALPALMTLGEVARYLRYETYQIRRFVEQGRLPKGQVAPKTELRFRRIDVERFEEEMFRKKAQNDHLNESNYS